MVGMKLEEHSDLHYVVSFPDQEAPALEELMDGVMVKQSTGSFVVVGVVVELSSSETIVRSCNSLTRPTVRDSG